jgi:hypothetical protein
MSWIESFQNWYDQSIKAVTILNVVYGLGEIVAYKIDSAKMLQPFSRKVTMACGGIFAGIFVGDLFYRMGATANKSGGWKGVWDKKTPFEKVSSGIAGFSVVAGWGAWLFGVCNMDAAALWQMWLIVGYLLGTSGHTFYMLSAFVKARREMKF